MASLTPGGEGRVLIGGGHTCPGAQVPQTKKLCRREVLSGLQQDAVAGEGQLGAELGRDLDLDSIFGGHANMERTGVGP